MSIEKLISDGKLILLLFGSVILLISNGLYNYSKQFTVSPNNNNIIFSSTINIDEVIYNNTGIPFPSGNKCIIHIVKNNNDNEYKIIMRTVK